MTSKKELPQLGTAIGILLHVTTSTDNTYQPAHPIIQRYGCYQLQ